MGIQPVKVDGSYVFGDEEILKQMEKVHVRKEDCSDDLNEDFVSKLQSDIENASNECIEDDDDDLNKKAQQSWQTSALAMHLPLAR